MSMAQDLSSKTIRLMVGVPPGGSNDFAARLISPHLAEALGATVIVENKVGAAGTIATDFVAKSAPDGTTLYFGGTGPILIAPQAMPKVPFNFLTDIMPINMVGETPLALAVFPGLGVKTLQEFIALSRTRPLSLASTGTGSLPHLVIESLIQASGGNILHVPYKGGGPALADAMGGHVSGVVQDVPTFIPLHEQGKLTLLAVTSAKRVEFLPNIPTVSETLPNFFSASSTLGVYAPAKTPRAIIDKINAALVKTVARDDVQERMRKSAIVPGATASPEAFQKLTALEYQRWGKLLREKGIVISAT
ncbi:tripartite tricarboxylate transporter substrate binding protein [Variovorax rhizosphaerae]|uniref:Tripartite tricarboxylate transporter substrate binding protein n=1 Tax=Variovorax rhizosphaerae TaxID=1836200 RepID=A0ABU8WTU5_9BURK